MNGLIHQFPADGVITVNRVILKQGYSIDDLQERVAMLCENVKTYHSDTGFVGGFVALAPQRHLPATVQRGSGPVRER
jgi:hypothetical protein